MRRFALVPLALCATPVFAQARITYDDNIKAILMKCAPCHTTQQPPQQPPLATYADARGKVADIIRLVESTDPAKRMPKNGAALDPSGIQMLKDWQANGTLEKQALPIGPSPKPPGGIGPRPSQTPGPRPTPSATPGAGGSPTPLVLDLGGSGNFTWSAEPVSFDIAADGRPVLLSWPGGDVAFLVLDRNGNGKIDDGSELFGDSTLLAGTRQRAKDGFAALAQFDGNTDALIDARDPIFAKLQLWVDANHDGNTDAGELRSLAQHKVTAFGTRYETIAGLGEPGQPALLLGSYHRDDDANGREIRILADIYLERLP